MAHPDTLSGAKTATEDQARGVGTYEWYENQNRQVHQMRRQQVLAHQLRRTRKVGGITILAGGVLLMASAIAMLPPVLVFLAGLVSFCGGAALWVEGDRQ